MIFRIITVLAVFGAGLTRYFWEGGPGFRQLLAMIGGYFAAYAVLTVLAFAFLVLLAALVDRKKPQEADSRLYRFFMYPYIEALMQLVGIRLTTEGLEKTPKEGRFLLVCNHQNEADPGVLHHCFPKSQIAFISKKENADMFVVGPFMHKTLCQMIDRENDREALKTILKCIQMIKDDQVSVGVFPEGGIKEEYKLSHFRPGVFKIAQKAKVPIVVCTIRGTTDLFRNIKRLKPTEVALHLLDVIPAEELEGKTTAQIADRVHAMMLNDLGEDWATQA